LIASISAAALFSASSTEEVPERTS
jgi:hypothetical protein